METGKTSLRTKQVNLNIIRHSGKEGVKRGVGGLRGL
jgi:hypothetical protein